MHYEIHSKKIRQGENNNMLKNASTNIFIAEQVLPVISKYIILFGILLILAGLIMALFNVITKPRLFTVQP